MNNSRTNTRTTDAVEAAIVEEDEKYYRLRLYIAGATINSIRALKNLKKICEEHLPGRYDLEVIDIYKQPELVLSENIVAMPTLIKKEPPPLQRLIGDLSDTEKVLCYLDILPQEYDI